MPQLVAIAGRNEEAVSEAARRYGFAEYKTDWKALIGDDRIELFDNAGPNNLHAEPTIAAAEAGKHVICEKPLGRDAAESYETWQRVQAAGVKHMCAFNYRFVPAVRLARQIIESGELGDIQHFRGAYLQEWGTTEGDIWRFQKDARGLGLARRPRRARDRPRALPRRRDHGRGGDDADVHRGPRRRRRRRVGRAVRERRGRHDRGLALLPRAARTPSRGRSTAPRARSSSTSSGSTSCSTPRATRASARSSCPRPTTRSGSTGGRRAT